ncbi:MAG: hypothetical protein KKH84_09650 [Proteobacteria bacterium]|nr:hypothetical protein [Pseudomonadota bacterium]
MKKMKKNCANHAVATIILAPQLPNASAFVSLFQIVRSDLEKTKKTLAP